jgi:hypothetical protein
MHFVFNGKEKCRRQRQDARVSEAVYLSYKLDDNVHVVTHSPVLEMDIEQAKLRQRFEEIFRKVLPRKKPRLFFDWNGAFA